MSRKRDRSSEPTSTPLPDGWLPYFPPPGAPVDVSASDLTCEDSSLEWWYYNAHLRATSDGRDISVFSSFFRRRMEGHPTSGATMFALADVRAQRYLPDVVFDDSAFPKFEAMISSEARGRPLSDLEELLVGWVRQKRLPYPSRVVDRPCEVTSPGGRLRFDMRDHLLEVVDRVHDAPAEAPSLSYHLKMCSPDGHGMDLTFTPQLQPVLHGDTGAVNSLYYYYIPRCTVSGTVTIDGKEEGVVGEGWYDREFGGTTSVESGNALDAWVWFSLQLDEGMGEYSLFSIFDPTAGQRKDHVSVYTKRGSERLVTHGATLSHDDDWTSMATLLTYPQSWVIEDPAIEATFLVHSVMPHQETPTILVDGGAFFEGRMSVSGTVAGKPITGRGYLEYKQAIPNNDTEGTLKRLSTVVRGALQKSYRDTASDEWIRTNVAGRNYVPEGTPPDLVCEAIFKPVRQLIDRGGKSWRSLLLTTTISALKKEYFDSEQYIIVPELMHVGSLIIDDIQDDSTIRRGGRCVHLDVGIPTAINAGTATYFMAPRLANIDGLRPEQQLAIYRLFFDCLRAGHAGQGLDILGLHHLFPSAIETGHVDKILKSLQAIHVYKTGGAAANVMMMACVIADSTEEQSEKMGNLGKAIGLAFQIVDDALNLRGFDGDLKEVGEDIRDGKITYPVLKALPKLTLDQRRHVGAVLAEKTSDQEKISSVIALLEGVGAIDACMEEARALIDEAWAAADAVMHDSIAKLLMRSFLTFLINRRH